MRHAVVGGATYESYKYEIWKMLEHALANHNTIGWLTPTAKTKLEEIKIELQAINRVRQRQQRKWRWLKDFLMQCETSPIVDIAKLTPETYMQFLQSQRNADGSLLRAKAYQTKTSALFHLFRCHPGLEGYPEGFEDRLKTLKTGFLRTVITRRADEGEDADGDGKKPMSHELYQCLAKWFFELGTAEGLFAHCFLVLTWNLMCRSNNTTRICLSHITWTWNSLVIWFAQQKGDQMGLTEKFPRNLYANPLNPLVCPVFALAAYLSTFDAAVDPNSKLFPGPSQYKQFSDLMDRVLREHEPELIALGYSGAADIGTHSICKGATKFISGQPGGPSAMSICIRGGWSLGGVKDVYMTYQAEGDAFCGRMLAMLPLLQATFASAPPRFNAPNVSEAELEAHREAHPNGIVLNDVFECVAGVFPSFDNRGSLQGVLHSCLAALAFHKDKVMSLPIVHHLRQNPEIFTDDFLLQRFSSNVKVNQPWDDGANGGALQFGSGIPPHVALQVCQQAMIRDLENYVSNFDSTMNCIFDERNVAAGEISEARMGTIITEVTNEIRTGFREELTAEIRRYGLGGEVQQPQNAARNATINNQRGFALHMYNGKFHRLPQDWRFPSCGLRQLWIKWNHGDTINNIPSLRSLNAPDLKHLDSLPNPNNEKRRPARKTFGDIKMVCTYIDSMARVNNFNTVGKSREELINFLTWLQRLRMDCYLQIKENITPNGELQSEPSVQQRKRNAVGNQ